MPEGIVRRCEHIVIYLVSLQLLCVIFIGAALFGIGKVHRHLGLGAAFPHCRRARADQTADFRPVRFPAEAAVGLVADLHHADVHTGFLQQLQRFLCKGIQGITLTVKVKAFPCLGYHLLCGVCPEIAVMEVHQQLHAVFRCPLSDGHRVVNIAVASAVAVARPVKRIVPDADTDIVDAVFGQNAVNILFLSFVVIIPDTALFQRRNAGSIHAQNEIRGQILHLLHNQRIGGHSRLCRFGFHRLLLPRAAARQQQAQQHRQQYTNFSHHHLARLVRTARSSMAQRSFLLS